eukprot:3021206-Rhodomonas_salina.3
MSSFLQNALNADDAVNSLSVRSLPIQVKPCDCLEFPDKLLGLLLRCCSRSPDEVSSSNNKEQQREAERVENVITLFSGEVFLQQDLYPVLARLGVLAVRHLLLYPLAIGLDSPVPPSPPLFLPTILSFPPSPLHISLPPSLPPSLP